MPQLRLSHVEEIELTRILNTYDKETRRHQRALEKLVTHNLGLVKKIAHKFPVKNASCTFDDLFQEGVAGLIHGVYKFDPEFGCRLSTYVYRWIAAYVRRYYQNHGRTIRIPVHLSDKQLQVNKQIESLTNQIGRTPTPEELTESVDGVEKVRSAFVNTVSLNSLVGDDLELESFVAKQNDVSDDKIDCELLLERVKSQFSKRDFWIVAKRYGLYGYPAHSLSELSDEYNLTRARIHQVEHNVLNAIRHEVSGDRKIPQVRVQSKKELTQVENVRG